MQDHDPRNSPDAALAADVPPYTWMNGHALPDPKISKRIPADECYPQVDHHVWQESASAAIELGGYGDMTLIDPTTGRRFWCAVPDQIWEKDSYSAGYSAALIYLIEHAQESGFFG